MITQSEFEAYCLAKPGATLDFPFDAETPVFRVLGKLFALCGIADRPLRINLKCDPDWALALRDMYPQAVLPGYHMNKRHWNTVICDGTLPDAEIWALVDYSYDIVLRSIPRRQREAAGLP